jgi:hypothetical protein
LSYTTVVGVPGVTKLGMVAMMKDPCTTYSQSHPDELRVTSDAVVHCRDLLACSRDVAAKAV